MHQTYRNRIAGVAIAALAAITAAGCSSSARAADAPATTTPGNGALTATAPYDGATIVVAGHGEATGTPDTMTMSIGVRTTQSSAQAALDQNDREATALETTLTAKGVEAKDMQTSDLSISPDYDQHGHITGYIASNMVTITLHGLGTAGERAGGVIDAGAAAVGNDITFDGVQLSIGDTSALLRQARANAIQQAIGHAKQLVEAAGMKLGTVRKIDDTGGQVPPPEFFNGPQALASSGEVAAKAPIAAGSQKVSVDVAVTFAIMQ